MPFDTDQYPRALSAIQDIARVEYEHAFQQSIVFAFVAQQSRLATIRGRSSDRLPVLGVASAVLAPTT